MLYKRAGHIILSIFPITCNFIKFNVIKIEMVQVQVSGMAFHAQALLQLTRLYYPSFTADGEYHVEYGVAQYPQVSFRRSDMTLSRHRNTFRFSSSTESHRSIRHPGSF
jgi:hypothetical protein